MVKNLPANTGNMGSILGQEDPLKEEMATHSNILAWEMGSQKNQTQQLSNCYLTTK